MINKSPRCVLSAVRTCIESRLSALPRCLVEEEHERPHEVVVEEQGNFANMPRQLCVYDARMERVYGDTRVFQSPRQLACEENVGEFALRVARNLAVRPLAVDVVLFDAAPAMRETRYVDNAAGLRCLSRGGEESREAAEWRPNLL
jgi:hypothetical protein